MLFENLDAYESFSLYVRLPIFLSIPADEEVLLSCPIFVRDHFYCCSARAAKEEEAVGDEIVSAVA